MRDTRSRLAELSRPKPQEGQAKLHISNRHRSTWSHAAASQLSTQIKAANPISGSHLGHVQVHLGSAQEGIQQLLGAVMEEVALLQLLYIPAEHQAQLQGSGVAKLHTDVMGE